MLVWQGIRRVKKFQRKNWKLGLFLDSSERLIFHIRMKRAHARRQVEKTPQCGLKSSNFSFFLLLLPKMRHLVVIANKKFMELREYRRSIELEILSRIRTIPTFGKF